LFHFLGLCGGLIEPRLEVRPPCSQAILIADLSSNLTGYETRLHRTETGRWSELIELANTDLEMWAKESFEIATKISSRRH
jgi:gas vesicle protein